MYLVRFVRNDGATLEDFYYVSKDSLILSRLFKGKKGSVEHSLLDELRETLELKERGVISLLETDNDPDLHMYVTTVLDNDIDIEIKIDDILEYFVDYRLGNYFYDDSYALVDFVELTSTEAFMVESVIRNYEKSKKHYKSLSDYFNHLKIWE